MPKHGIRHILGLNNESLRNMDCVNVFLSQADERLCLFYPHTAGNQLIAADAHIDTQASAYALARIALSTEIGQRTLFSKLPPYSSVR